MRRNRLRLIAYGSLALAWITVSATACEGPPRNVADTQSQPEENMQADINAAQQRLTEIVMALPGVVGIGQSVCGDKPCFRVYVSDLTPELKRRIPQSFEGITVEVVESGAFRAQKPQRKVATVLGPFGKILGIIEDPLFDPQKVE